MPGNIINLTPADIAAWPTPNYVNPPEERGATAYALCLYAAATVVFILRIALRVAKTAGGLGLDDVHGSINSLLSEKLADPIQQAFIVVAWLCASAFTAVMCAVDIKYHIGRHIWDIPLGDYEGMALQAWIAQVLFLVSSACTKISILFCYRRLVEGSYHRRWKWATYLAIGFTACWALAFILSLVFSCSPTEAYWKVASMQLIRSSLR